MGNSSSHSTHHHHGSKNGRSPPPASPPQHYVHSLPRDGGASQKHYNGGFKVLPERVPGQKLRLTDNGNLLQNGGTLTGRKLGGSEIGQQQHQEVVDVEFLKVLRRRADSAQEIRRGDHYHHHHHHQPPEEAAPRTTTAMGKKYYSDPDLLNSPGIISSNPSGVLPERHGKVAKKKFLLRSKTKAPPPPPGGVEGSNDADHLAALPKGRKSPTTKDGGPRRGFVGFLKPISGPQRKPAVVAEDSRSRLSVASSSGDTSAVTTPAAARLDSKDRSITYVLERRLQDVPTRRTQSPQPLLLPQQQKHHLPLQGKLSDGVQARSIDRADLRTGRLAELQKRVRSMDSLANADDRQSLYMPPAQPSGGLLKATGHHLNGGQWPRVFKQQDVGGKDETSAPPEPVDKEPGLIPRPLVFGGGRKGPSTTMMDPFLRNLERPPFHHPQHGGRDRSSPDAEAAAPESGDFAFDPFKKDKQQKQAVVSTEDRPPARTEQKLHQQDRSDPGGGDDDDLSNEDEMDISMQLRPTLPKRLLSLPRFSPTQVWRSFTLEDAVVASAGEGDDGGGGGSSSDDDDGEEEGDVFEDRIHRIAKPIAPPRSSHEKSADSGISPGANSPIPLLYEFDAAFQDKTTTEAATPPKQQQQRSPAPPQTRTSDDRSKPMWTPEEDLASDFDAGSGEHHMPTQVPWTAPSTEMVSSQPKLTSRNNMFFLRRSSMDQDLKDSLPPPPPPPPETTTATDTRKSESPVKYNSVRKLKRSLSGVLQGGGGGSGGGRQRSTAADEVQKSLDENWSLSRSLPNSLHNGLEGETREGHHHQKRDDKAGGGRTAVPPFVQRLLPRSESGPIYDRRPSSELLVVEGRRPLDASEAWDPVPYNRHIVYLPKYEAMEIVPSEEMLASSRRAYSDLGTGSKTEAAGSFLGRSKPFKKFSYQSTVRQLERKQLEQKLSEVVAVKEKQRSREMELVNKVEEEFQRKRDKEKANIRQQLRILSMEYKEPPANGGGYHEGNTRSLPREYPAYEGAGGGDSGERMLLSLPPMVIPPEDYYMTLGRGYSRGGRQEEDETEVAPKGGGFFGGIGKWMRRQQRMEKGAVDEWSPSRQEPDGAPASLGHTNGSLVDGHHSYAAAALPPPPYQRTRSQVLSGARFSSGRLPMDDGDPSEAAAHGRGANSAVWISAPADPRNQFSRSDNFYDVPYDSYSRVHLNGAYDQQQLLRPSYPPPPPAPQRDWSATGQRHSIAVDFSGRDKWTTSSPGDYRKPHRSGFVDGDGNSLDYRRRYNADYNNSMGAMLHQRSLSCNRIWDDDDDDAKAADVEGGGAARTLHQVSPIQPFVPNKSMYRPVAFPLAATRGN